MATPADPLDALPTYWLRNASGVEVCIRPLGAVIQRLLLPDAAGVKADVVLGFDGLRPYEDGTSPYFGAIVGRVANRIDKGRFTIGGETFQVSRNENGNTLHGGSIGFDKAVWEVVDAEEGRRIKLRHVSPDGDQGFPGRCTLTVEYVLSDAVSGGDGKSSLGMLSVAMSATTTKACPITIAGHSYWNLSGGGSILGHKLWLDAPGYTPVGAGLIPTGETTEVKGTAFDFTKADGTPIGDRIAEVPGGYDHNFCLAPATGVRPIARLVDPASGRGFVLSCDQPACQFYAGGMLGGEKGKGGAVYDKHGGLCLETQGYPNAINTPAFPSCLVGPEQVYSHTMEYAFSCE